MGNRTTSMKRYVRVLLSRDDKVLMEEAVTIQVPKQHDIFRQLDGSKAKISYDRNNLVVKRQISKKKATNLLLILEPTFQR